MPQLIRPQNVKIITKEGELQVNIVLELNINLNAGGLEVSANTKEIKEIPVKQEDTWEIPDFGPTPKISFGRKE